MASKKRSYNKPSVSLYNHRANSACGDEIENEAPVSFRQEAVGVGASPIKRGNDDIPYR
jgi:hypothetical protein